MPSSTKNAVDGLQYYLRYAAFRGLNLTFEVREGIIKPKPEAKFVVQHCEYGYTTNTPIEVVLQDNFLLATHFDGKPLELAD